MKSETKIRSLKSKKIFGLSCLLILSAQTLLVEGQVVDWNGTKDSNWNTPDNWSSGYVPGSVPGDSVVLSGSNDAPVVATQVGTSNSCFVRLIDEAFLEVCDGKLLCNEIILGGEVGLGGGHLKLWSSANIEVKGGLQVGKTAGATSESSLELGAGSLTVGGEVYVGKGLLEIEGDESSIIVNDLTVASNATLRFDFDLYPVSTIQVADHFSIGDGAKLEIDLRGYNMGGNELELVRFSSVSGSFDPEDIIITGLGGGLVTMDDNSLNLTVIDDVIARSCVLWFVATGGSGTDVLDLQVNTGRRIRNLSSPDMSYTLTADGDVKVYSASWSGSDFNGDGVNDSVSFDLRVEGFSGSTYTYNGQTASMKALGGSASVKGDSDGWGVGTGDNLDAGQTLRFSVENLQLSTPGGELEGFVGVQLVEPDGGSNHILIFGQGENLDSKESNSAVSIGFSPEKPLLVTSAANSNVRVNRVALKLVVSELPDFLDTETGDYSHYPTGPQHRSEYPAPTNIKYPEFSWNTLPMSAGVHRNDKIPENIAELMANTYPLIYLGGRNFYGEDYVEDGMSAVAATLKKYNPKVHTVTYRNAGLHHDRMRENENYNRDWSIYTLDENGNRVYDVIRLWDRYNHNYPEFRKWWSDWCVARLEDPNIDAIFIDKATGGDAALLNDDGMIEAGSNRVKSYVSIWERLPEGDVLTGNVLRTSRFGGSRELMHIFNSTYLEGWKSGNDESLIAMSDADGTCASLQMIREARVKGMIVNPNYSNLNHFVLSGEEAEAMIAEGRADEVIDIIREEIQLPLAYHLITMAPYSYFSFQVTKSGGPELLWNTKPYIEEFRNPLGKPLGPPVKDGYIFTRSFEHLDVWLNVETEECKLTWDWMPIADPQDVDAERNQSNAITLTGSDPRETDLNYLVSSQPTNGVLTGTAPNLVYTPNEGFVGKDSFTFKTSNDMAESLKAKVSITVSGGSLSANDANFSTAINTPLNITLTGYDPDGINLTYSIQSQPKNGTLTGIAPDLIYTPAWGYVGTDSLTFIVNNGEANSEPATVSIRVTAEGSIEYTFDTPGHISGGSNTIVYTAPDLNTFNAVTASHLELDDGIDAEGNYNDNYGRIEQNGGDSPEALVVALDEPAQIMFTLDIDATERVSFTKISFDVSYWNSFSVETIYDWTFKTIVGTITNNDTTSESFSHAGRDIGSYQKFAGAGDIELTGLSDLTDTSVTFIWEFNANKAANFSRRRMGLDNVIIQGIVSSPGSAPPVAQGDSIETLINTPVNITLTGTDPEGSNLTYALVDSTSRGVLSGDAPDLTYTPANGYVGTDSFAFIVNDGETNSDPATVWIRVVDDNNLSVEDLNMTGGEVNIFPIPSNGIINITIENSISNTIEIFNAYGMLIYRNENASPYEEINLSGLPKGIYFLKTNNDKLQKVLII